MIEAFYAVSIIAFGCLSVFTLFTHMIKGGDIRDANVESQAQYDRLDERLTELRAQSQELRFNTELLDEERVALEAQGQCMLELEEESRRLDEAEEQQGS